MRFIRFRWIHSKRSRALNETGNLAETRILQLPSIKQLLSSPETRLFDLIIEPRLEVPLVRKIRRHESKYICLPAHFS